MAEIGPLSMKIDASGLMASLTSVIDVLIASRGAFETFTQHIPGVFQSDGLGGFDLSDEGVSLLWGKCVNVPTSRAGELVSIQFHPSDAFLETVAAIAGNGDAHIVFSHGWPILSLVGGTSSMTEAAGASSSGRGGSPA